MCSVLCCNTTVRYMSWHLQCVTCCDVYGVFHVVTFVVCFCALTSLKRSVVWPSHCVSDPSINGMFGQATTCIPRPNNKSAFYGLALSVRSMLWYHQYVPCPNINFYGFTSLVCLVTKQFVPIYWTVRFGKRFLIKNFNGFWRCLAAKRHMITLATFKISERAEISVCACACLFNSTSVNKLLAKLFSYSVVYWFILPQSSCVKSYTSMVFLVIICFQPVLLAIWETH